MTTQTKPAFTAGPWKLEAKDSPLSARIGSASDLQASGLVARVYGNNPDHVHANAALIMAAPDLLAIAKLYAADLVEAGMNDGPRFRQVESAIQAATAGSGT